MKPRQGGGAAQNLPAHPKPPKMPGPLDPTVTTNEAAFAKAVLQAGLRADGRGSGDVRPPTFDFSPGGANATVALGDTRACATVSAVLEPPYADR